MWRAKIGCQHPKLHWMSPLLKFWERYHHEGLVESRTAPSNPFYDFPGAVARDLHPGLEILSPPSPIALET
ncbi:hypothetical protein KY289_032493 [Solanum tuberosum]|nr:hypothetical protein KY289_032493 [Solanum tuberosum]